MTAFVDALLSLSLSFSLSPPGAFSCHAPRLVERGMSRLCRERLEADASERTAEQERERKTSLFFFVSLSFSMPPFAMLFFENADLFCTNLFRGLAAPPAPRACLLAEALLLTRCYALSNGLSRETDREREGAAFSLPLSLFSSFSTIDFLSVQIDLAIVVLPFFPTHLFPFFPLRLLYQTVQDRAVQASGDDGPELRR